MGCFEHWLRVDIGWFVKVSSRFLWSEVLMIMKPDAVRPWQRVIISRCETYCCLEGTPRQTTIQSHSKNIKKIMDVGAKCFFSPFEIAAEWKGEPQRDRGCSVVYSCWSETDVATTTSSRTLRTMVMSHTVKPLWNCHIKWTCCWKLCWLSKFYGLWSRKSLQKQITYRKWKRGACSAKAKVPPRFAIANKLITDFVSPQLPVSPVSWHLHSHSGHQEDIHEKKMSCPF